MLDFLKSGIVELVLIMYCKGAHKKANIKYIIYNTGLHYKSFFINTHLLVLQSLNSVPLLIWF